MPGRSPSIRLVRMIVVAMIGIIPAPAPTVRRPGINRPVRSPARRPMTDRRAIPRSARHMPARRPTPRHMSGTTSSRWPSPRTTATRRLTPRTTSSGWLTTRTSRRPAPRPATRRMRRSRLHNGLPPRLMPTRTTRPSRPRLLPRRRPAILRPDNGPGHNCHDKNQKKAKTRG
jgi:hypothetical protein